MKKYSSHGINQFLARKCMQYDFVNKDWTEMKNSVHQKEKVKLNRRSFR
jgi:hypothetical protein